MRFGINDGNEVGTTTHDMTLSKSNGKAKLDVNGNVKAKDYLDKDGNSLINKI